MRLCSVTQFVGLAYFKSWLDNELSWWEQPKSASWNRIHVCLYYPEAYAQISHKLRDTLVALQNLNQLILLNQINQASLNEGLRSVAKRAGGYTEPAAGLHFLDT